LDRHLDGSIVKVVPQSTKEPATALFALPPSGRSAHSAKPQSGSNSEPYALPKTLLTWPTIVSASFVSDRVPRFGPRPPSQLLYSQFASFVGVHSAGRPRGLPAAESILAECQA